MKFLEVDGTYINIDKIIAVYEYKGPQAIEKSTTVEFEGFSVHDAGPCGEFFYYEQNYIRTDLSVDEVMKLIAELIGNGG